MELKLLWIFPKIWLEILVIKLYKLLLTDAQVTKICKAFVNGSSANIKFQKLNSLNLNN